MRQIHYIQLSVLLVSFALISCDDSPTDSGTGCPDIPKDAYGIIMTVNSYIKASLSCDNRTLAYVNEFGAMYLCDVLTQKQTPLPSIKLPSNVMIYGISHFDWCPYASDQLVIHAFTYTDTTGNWIHPIYAENAYIIRTNGDLIQRITPTRYPSWGSTSGGLAGPLWLAGSTTEVDSIRLSSGIYIPQEDKTIEPAITISSQSSDGLYWYGKNPSAWDNFRINGSILRFDGFPPEYGAGVSCFSPSGKYLAIAGLNTPQAGSTDVPNLWIIDVAAFLNGEASSSYVVNAINVQKEYCKYSMGIYPVFITDTTLAISMYEAYAASAHYYEISIDGNFIRQLSQF